MTERTLEIHLARTSYEHKELFRRIGPSMKWYAK